MKELYKKYFKAQEFFMMYAMKFSYGLVQDRTNNFKMSKYWEAEMKNLRNQIVNNQKDERSEG